jgi:hypothetical protein
MIVSVAVCPSCKRPGPALSRGGGWWWLVPHLRRGAGRFCPGSCRRVRVPRAGRG